MTRSGDVLNGNCIKPLAGRYDLPVFIGMWVWATARLIAYGEQPDALLAADKRNKFEPSTNQRLPCVKGAVKNPLIFD